MVAYLDEGGGSTSSREGSRPDPARWISLFQH